MTELDNLGREAGAVDAMEQAQAFGPEQPQPEAEQKIDYVGMIAGVLDTGAHTVGVVYPFVPKHYTPEQNKQIAASIVALAEAYDVDLAKLLGKMLLWLQLATACGMPALGCIAEYRKQQIAEAERAGQAEPAAAAPGEAQQPEPKKKKAA